MKPKDYWDYYPPKVFLEDLNLNEDETQFDLDQNQGFFPSQGTYCPQLTVIYHIIPSNVYKSKPPRHEYKGRDIILTLNFSVQFKITAI